MIKKWDLEKTVPNLAAQAQKLGVSELIAGILWHRNIRTKTAAEAFLKPEKQPFHSPWLMKDMEPAVERICQAIDAGEKITVYGDYDVDGITATSIMVHNLQALGATVKYYIPDRKLEGYGLNLPAMQKLAATGTKLLLTVDCGIASVNDIAAMQGQLDIIVTDHHLPGSELPPAIAVVNPHRVDCEYPDKNLAGVGVAFKLCQALWERLEGEHYDRDLEIVALGTVADIVPLLGENRRIVKAGLQAMATTNFVGIKALMEVAEVPADKVDSSHVGFRLAPRLNAAGRLKSARAGVELILTKDKAKAAELAAEMDELNTQRQSIEQAILDLAEADLTGQNPHDLPAIVVAGRNWNPGVIGIVASRLVEKYYKPTIVFSIQSDGVCKGSCRSIAGLHMYNTLQKCQTEIIQFGGHAQAAGLSIAENKLADFKEAFSKACAETLSDDDYIPRVKVEAELAPSDITIELVEELASLEPYGMANEKPLFGVRNLRGSSAVAIGKEKQHLRFQAGTEDAPRNALYWNHGDLAHVVNAESLDMVYSPTINEWQGKISLQCMVDSLAPAQSEQTVPERDTLVVIYKTLYRLQQPAGKIPYTAQDLAGQLAMAGEHISLYTLQIGLKIFQELGLLRADLTEQGFYLPPNSPKMNLANSPTYCRYHR